MKRKLFMISIITFLTMFMPVVFASTVKVNGGTLDIYGGGSGSATFDSTTNTLTLNGYDDEYIWFDGFDGKTINVVLKGNNKISPKSTPPEDSVGLGVDYNTNIDNITFNIKGEEGSKLTIDGYENGVFIDRGALNIENTNIEINNANDYAIILGHGDLKVKKSTISIDTAYNGIYVYDGNLYVEDSNITLKNIGYVGIYAEYGELLSIKDTTVNADNMEYVIANDEYDVEIDNLTLNSVNVAADDFYVYGKLTLKNSNLDLKEGGQAVYATDAEIEGTNFTIENKDDGIYIDNELVIKNCTFNVSGIEIGDLFESDNQIQIEDSKITSENVEKIIVVDDFVSIKNTTIEANKGLNIIYGPSELDGVTVKTKDVEVLFDGFGHTIKNSTIEAIGGTGTINGYIVEIDNSNITVKDSAMFMEGFDTMITNSNIKAETNNECIISMGPITIDNSNVKLKSKDMVAFYILAFAEADFDDAVILKNTTLLNKNLIKGKSMVTLPDESFAYILAYVTEEPKASYTFDELTDIMGIAPKELTFVAKCRVSFDANGGSGEMDDIVAKGKVTLPENGFTAPEGKVFKGWSLTKDGKLVTEVDVNDTVILYAIWEDKETEKETEKEKVPETLDNIILYASIGAASILALGICLKLTKKNN